jgi:hypothetical protein
MAAPAAEQKDPVAITAPLREWAALLAVIAPMALQFFALIVLLFDNAPFGGLGGSFSDRANATFGDFVSPLTIFLPLVGVLLATHVKPPVAKAKLITLLAMIGYGVAALMGLVTMFATFIHTVGLDLPGTVLHSFVTLLARLIVLGVLAFAGFIVVRVFFGAYTPVTRATPVTHSSRATRSSSPPATCSRAVTRNRVTSSRRRSSRRTPRRHTSSRPGTPRATGSRPRPRLRHPPCSPARHRRSVARTRPTR